MKAKRKLPPKLNHVQILILNFIRINERVSGPEIREELQNYNEIKTGPSFYQMMGRLEKSKFVDGQCKVFKVKGKSYRERFYKITEKGCITLDATWEFYTNLMVLK